MTRRPNYLLPGLLVGMVVGLLLGYAGAIRQVKQCRAAVVPRSIMATCPAWLK